VVRVFGETPFLFAETSQPLDEGDECEFPTSDGLILRGTYLATHVEQRQGVIAFCHEMTSDRWSCTPYVRDLLHRGYDVFAFDFRNHGQSDRMPGYEPIPWLTRFELEDVLAAVDYLCSRDDADPQGVALLGVSRGGTAALCAAACDGRIRAVVTDGAFPLEEMQLHYMRRYMQIYLRYSWLLSKLPDVSLSSFCRWGRYFVGMRRGCQFINVTQMTRKIRQPVFMIHGDRDTYVPLEVVHLLRSSISRRTRLWVVPGAKHNRAIGIATQQYHRRIGRFFSNHLANQPTVARVKQLNRAAG
jgi:pimeloyl-ACP methyl ester carboxylesterase